jgi:hypothetical protein
MRFEDEASETNLILYNIQDHSVDMYINGHDHCLEHLTSTSRYAQSTKHLYVRGDLKVFLPRSVMELDFNAATSNF